MKSTICYYKLSWHKCFLHDFELKITHSYCSCALCVAWYSCIIKPHLHYLLLLALLSSMMIFNSHLSIKVTLVFSHFSHLGIIFSLSFTIKLVRQTDRNFWGYKLPTFSKIFPSIFEVFFELIIKMIKYFMMFIMTGYSIYSITLSKASVMVIILKWKNYSWCMLSDIILVTLGNRHSRLTDNSACG